MALTAEDKANIVKEYQIKEGDTGSPEVQVALQTARIKDLSPHFKRAYPRSSFTPGSITFSKPASKVARLFKKNDVERYRALIKSLGLRK